MSEHNIIYIKNMVCDRCIATVKNDLDSLSIKYLDIKLGQVALKHALDSNTKNELEQVLEKQGFELLESRTSKLIEAIKNTIRDWVHIPETRGKQKMSELISDKLSHEYSSLSSLFSSVEGVTIEKYLILQKIEKVKELIMYDELSLSEISYQLDYSSVQHLSSQFKSVTGMTPSQYRKQNITDRKPLDRV